jgi:hypothetical protein
VRRTARSVVVAGDVVNLSMAAAMDATGGVVPWITVSPDALVPLVIWQTMRRWTTTTINHRNVLVRGG